MARAEDGGDLTSISDQEQRARLARLMPRRTKLTASEAEEVRQLFPLIVRAHQRRARAQLRRRGLSPAEIDDLLQDAFLRLHVSIERRGFPESIAALLYTITRRRLANHRRGKEREPFSVGLPSSASEPPRSPPDPGRVLDRQAARQWLFSQLSSEEGAILEAVELDELTYEEASLALDVPFGTFKRRLIRAREKLAELLRQLKARDGEAA